MGFFLCIWRRTLRQVLRWRNQEHHLDTFITLCTKILSFIHEDNKIMDEIVVVAAWGTQVTKPRLFISGFRAYVGEHFVAVDHSKNMTSCLCKFRLFRLCALKCWEVRFKDHSCIGLLNFFVRCCCCLQTISARKFFFLWRCQWQLDP